MSESWESKSRTHKPHAGAVYGAKIENICGTPNFWKRLFAADTIFYVSKTKT